MSISPSSAFPPTSSAAPMNPTASPITTTRGWRCPRTTRSIAAIHSGTVAIARPAIPEGIVRSAQTMPPLPPNIISAATTAAPRQWAARGRSPRRSPNRSATGSSRPPAIRKRRPPPSNGGIVSLTTLMATNVVLHAT